MRPGAVHQQFLAQNCRAKIRCPAPFEGVGAHGDDFDFLPAYPGRGQHAGLSIPDFPLAYGKLWPDISPAAVARYNADRMDVLAENPITAFQIVLQMVHRLVAVLILATVAGCAWQARKIPAPVHRRLSIFWLALIGGQIGLGAATIWTDKAADVATLHLMGGALALATGALWCLVNFRRPAEAANALRTAQAAAPLSGALGTATNH
jgi:cytochrome c oxidase assembly protein subunit 15